MSVGSRKRFSGERVSLVVAGVVGLVVGALLRGLLPPFVLDNEFWRDFWSGPPVAGLFALAAATVAFYPAHRSTFIAREASEREQWWNRAEWALGMASSDSQTNREVGNGALKTLLESATETEAKMIVVTIENLQGASSMDTPSDTSDNRSWRRWVPWLS